VNNHLLRGKVHGKINFLVGALLVTIMESVDHALAHAHPDTVAVVLTKPRRFRHSETHLLSEIDALDDRLQRHFKVLGLGRHLFALRLPRVPLM